MLAASSGRTVRLWDVATWQLVAAFTEATAEDACFAFSPDSKFLATGDADGTLRVWNVAQQWQVASRRGHTSKIASVTFSPDGRRVATGGGDGTVKLWDVALLQDVATLTGHARPVCFAAFSPDGNTLTTASADATVRLRQAPPSAAAFHEPADASSVLPPVETIRLFSLIRDGTAQATLAVEGSAHRFDVTAVDGTNWHAKATQLFDDLQEGATYTIRFRAKADVPRSMILYGQINEPDWHGIGLGQDVPLTEEWQAYQYEFRAKDLAGWNRIQFLVGERTGIVWIADFTLTKDAN
jgi:hypothetical protein